MLAKGKFGQAVGTFTASSFLLGGRAVTGTSDGDVVVWEAPEGDDNAGPGERLGERHAAKLIRLGEGALTVVTTVGDQFLCLAGEDGAVSCTLHQRLPSLLALWLVAVHAFVFKNHTFLLRCHQLQAPL